VRGVIVICSSPLDRSLINGTLVQLGREDTADLGAIFKPDRSDIPCYLMNTEQARVFDPLLIAAKRVKAYIFEGN